MKNFTIAIIAAALLLVLGGCVYSGDPSVGGYYSYGYPYTHLYGGAYYDNYSWPYRYGFNSYRYRHDVYNHGRQPDRAYRHGQRHHDSRSMGPVYSRDRQGFGRHSGNRGNRTDGRQVRCLNGRC